MPPRNVIVFGDPTRTRLVLKLAGAQVNDNDPSPTAIFETDKGHSATISNQEYMLYETACLDTFDSGTMEARQAFGNLYHLTHKLGGAKIHLLIYAISSQPSPNNISLFRDYLCRVDCPIILFAHPTSPPTPTDLSYAAVTLYAEHFNAKALQDAIDRHVKIDPMSVAPMVRFELTARESWNTLGREAGWSLTECRKALETTLLEDAKFLPLEAEKKCQEIAEYIKKNYFCNVIVFGDTGAGKSSVIQMLTDEIFNTKNASSAGGSTTESKAYDIDIDENHFRFHDTVGHDDQTKASKSPEEALRNLYQLMRKVDGGVSLLVYVHRGRIKPSQVFNYQLFSHVICEKQVPTVLVVTGLEEEDDLDEDDCQWWNNNKHLFTEQNMNAEYYACITSTKGKFRRSRREFTYQTEYDKSKKKLKKLFLRAGGEKPWKIKNTPGFLKSLMVEFYNFFATEFKLGPRAANPLLQKRLMEILGMKDDAAMSLTNNMERRLPFTSYSTSSVTLNSTRGGGATESTSTFDTLAS